MLVSGIDFFTRAKSIRLKSYHDKYLTADPDKHSVVQDRSGSSPSATWTLEFVEGVEDVHVIRLKSCHGTYLTALDEEYLLGVTGRKVVQTRPAKLDSSVEWEPIRDGMRVKLKTRYGNYLRANGGLPPWRNSITHDIPHRHHDWVSWEVEVVEARSESEPKPEPPRVSRSGSLEHDLSSLRLTSQSGIPLEDSPRKSEGRLIYYYVVDDNVDDGNIDDVNEEGPCFQFRGHRLEELTQKLEEKTGLVDIIVCSRNHINGQLYPLRLSLPPNNATMHVVVVPPTSRVAREFLPSTPTLTST